MKMREHKFKAWDKRQKKWLGVNLHMSVIDGTLWWQFGYGCDILSAEERENIELVEYIGRKDKNGKEIYEGDIVRDVEAEIGIIKWSKRECLLFVDYPFNQDYMMIEDSFSSEPEKNIEIVTNIYEDPEFFKGAKQQT